MESPLTHEQRENVLEAMEDGFDANDGFNWSLMDMYICDEYDAGLK